MAGPLRGGGGGRGGKGPAIKGKKFKKLTFFLKLCCHLKIKIILL